MDGDSDIPFRFWGGDSEITAQHSLTVAEQRRMEAWQ